MKKLHTILLLLFIILLAGVVRLYQLGNVPPSLYWDEVAIGIDAYAIAKSGLDIHGHSWLQPIFPSYGDFKAPVYIWLTTIAVKLFGLNNFSVRLAGAFFGTLLIPAIYFLVKELSAYCKGKLSCNLPMTVALIVAFSPWAIHFSRIGFESFLSLFWLVLSLLFFLKGLRSSGFYFLLASLMFSLSIYSYFAARIIVPLIFLALLMIFYKKIWRKKLWLVFSAMILIVSLLPLLRSPYYSASQNYRLSTKSILNDDALINESSYYLARHDSSLLAKLSYHRYWFMGREFFDHYSSHFSPSFLFFWGEANLRHNSGFSGQFLTVLLPLLLIGFYALAGAISSKSSLVAAAFLLIAPIASSIPYEVPSASRSIYLFLPLVMIIGLGVNKVFDSCPISKKNLSLGLACLVFINFGLYFHDYLVHYPGRSSQAWIYANRQVAEYVKQNREHQEVEKITERYWMPQLYLIFAMPEIIEKLSQEKDENTGLADLSQQRIVKEIEKSVVTEEEKVNIEILAPEEASNQYVLKHFYFLDGQESLQVVEKI